MLGVWGSCLSVVVFAVAVKQLLPSENFNFASVALALWQQRPMIFKPSVPISLIYAAPSLSDCFAGCCIVVEIAFVIAVV